MKNRNTSRRVVTKLNSLTLLGVLIVAAAVMDAPVYSLRSHAADRNSADGRAVRSEAHNVSSSTASTRWGTVLTTLLPAPPPSLTIATFEYSGTACTNTPKTSFNLGETVCATITGAPLGSPGSPAV